MTALSCHRGTFVVIEGIDGAGTTSQARRLVAELARRGVRFHLTAEPSQGPVGRLIRELLGRVDDPPDPRAMALLFAADRVDHWQREIDPQLRQGRHVLTDRYVLSSLAYQGKDVALDWVRTLNREAPAPDLTVLLDVSPEVALGRRTARGGVAEIYDDLGEQRRIAELYRSLLRELPGHRACTIDADRDFEAVQADFLAVVTARLGDHAAP